MENAQPMSAADYRRQHAMSVVAPSDFAASDKDFFAGNGRLHSCKPRRY